MTVLLEPDQKALFARWLEHEISTADGIVGEMQKIGTPEPILRKFRTEQLACTIVLKMITSGESMTLG